ncbi:DEAD/DEAH box helicase family protein [Dialister sp.]|uniref:DEAD/DEAH box helicase n=1 Tax=Dialister sp. TaxID=1955814 RepID=UPI003A5C03B7
MKPQPGDTRKPEWFHIDPETAKRMLDDFRENRGLSKSLQHVIPYTLRKEQQEAVDKAKDYFLSHERGKFLFNCKPRFGKTLTVYDLCKTMNLEKVLVVTNRPAIANSWFEDYCKFLGRESGYLFVSEVAGLKGKPGVYSRDDFTKAMLDAGDALKCIEFVSLQDLKGAKAFGGAFDKLTEVARLHWDILVIDEAHEGVATYKTDVAFDHISRKYTLHLSGTPFKAIANGDFSEDAIYNWTYADEQKAKAEWKSEDGSENPYANLPKLNMYTYRMSDMVSDLIDQGIEIDGKTEEYAFDLNEFFATDDRGYFIHNEAVDKFLDSLVTGKKYPFSTPELRGELKHTLWLLNRVASAKALERKLKKHPVFGNGNYEIILAAGDGRGEDDDQVTESALQRVKEAIKTHDKTITLSVGQLTTGVTVPEWSAVLMLSSIQSEALYMQAAFRAQNPCRFHEGTEFLRKQNAYIFDFDPARTLIAFEKFANDLYRDTSGGSGDTETRKKRVKELLNFFPVIGEDENGEMIELDAAKVLSIPRRIKSQEVVRRGFMSNFLFRNISNIFGAPKEVIDIINKLEPFKEQKPVDNLDENTGDRLDIDDDGNVSIPQENIIGTSNDMFGDKIYKDAESDIQDVVDSLDTARIAHEEDPKSKAVQEQIDRLKDAFHEKSKQLLDTAKETYQSDLSNRTRQQLEKSINNRVDTAINRAADNLRIETGRAKNDLKEKLKTVESKKEEQEVREEYQKKVQDIQNDFQKEVKDTLTREIHAAGETVVDRVETDKRVKEKNDIESSVRDHLRGFARTIPAFLMAYGSDKTTLANFDHMVPSNVFEEVTRNAQTGKCISLDEFRFLRDGGDYYERDEKGREIRDEAHKKHFDGHLFDEVVFNDSVKEFMNKRRALANYFDESHKEDIFNYIPPQETNQIFTPKKVVVKMVDLLEKENPGCFDDDKKTFADLYMKSGMYITEIVKRLFNSPRMKKLYPDDGERLNHIFAKQVYGLAPTEIIYHICLNYILGFSDKIRIKKNNIRLCNSLAYAEKGTLEMKLKELFPELK